MDLSWVVNLTAAQSVTLIIVMLISLGGLAAMLVLAKHLGLSIGKNGLVFRADEKTDAILETVNAIKASDGRQEEEIRLLGEKVNNNIKDTLRLTFYNPLLSPANRLVAGKRYLAAGGNGETQGDIQEFAAQHPGIWQGILAVKGE